ncbi:hypothetical protein KDW_07320 [Dictyobacter vulcani]|uniref:Uncharacterized protein n=2 Tax=Dictyobacter vulcani TaxID=2607529 RepID=A0A5J4KJN5_9CHLR|nr:hypothetical protein KDW_07320 [Dictyobacter vulcani]
MPQQKKIKLEDLRKTIPFDIPTTAIQAYVSPLAVYHMISGHPVSREEAERVLAALSTDERPLSLDTIDIVLWEDFLVLHCARATDGVNFNQDQFSFIYARDEVHARRLFYTWSTHVNHAHMYVTPMPQGIVIGTTTIPGTQQIRHDKNTENPT